MYVIKVNSSNTLVQASHYLQLMLISMLISMPKLALTKSECHWQFFKNVSSLD